MADPKTPYVATTSTADFVTPDAVIPSTPKRARVQVTYNSPGDDLMPLIIATTDIKLNYKAMAALDPHNRTASALEHKFRNFRSAAKDLLAAAKGKEDRLSASEADEPSSNKGQEVHGKKTGTPARKKPVKASPKGKKVATAMDDVTSGQEDGPPSKKRKVTRKRHEKVNEF